MIVSFAGLEFITSYTYYEQGAAVTNGVVPRFGLVYRRLTDRMYP